MEDAVPAHTLRKITAVDVFLKPKEDYQRAQTPLGGLLSLASALVIVILVVWEVAGYALGWDAYHTDTSVDNNPCRSMKVTVDISFPRVPCSSLSVDVVDISGSKKFNISDSITKVPLSGTGKWMFEGKEIDLYQSVLDEVGEEAWKCARCFLYDDRRRLGNKVDVNQKLIKNYCCNSCASVLEAYAKQKITQPSKGTIPQCSSELTQGPGCRVIGALHLKKIAGTIIFGPKRHKQMYMVSDVIKFDSSHIIHRFEIGTPTVTRFSDSGPVVFPLNGQKYQSDALSEVKYFVKVVPTTYNIGRRRQMPLARTYEYSAQWNHRGVLAGLNGEIPVVLIGLDVSPVQVDKYFARPPFGQFVIRLCGVVGGLFVILGVVDGVVAHVFG